MIVHTRSGTRYEFRRTEKGWEGFRHNELRMLHESIDHWIPVRIMWQPEAGFRMSVQFEGYDPWMTTKVLGLEISAEERDAFTEQGPPA